MDFLFEFLLDGLVDLILGLLLLGLGRLILKYSLSLEKRHLESSEEACALAGLSGWLVIGVVGYLAWRVLH